ncbi:MAG: hypothetical protein JXA82_12290, partial [Sedimentisphaerales bacterium]|nr:hypothetical protein [Sedimentisphaerales bacterium]
LAEATNTIVAMVEMVPNQPLRFTDETRSRSEDAIIAYSWDKYMTTEDPEWIAQLPMTKAAVRAMDTVQDFLAQPAQGGMAIDSFFVTGASKRGWTAWLTAAVDNRVIGVAPLVIDMLNTQKSFRHHHAVYGFFAPAVSDYQEMGIFNKLNSPEAEQLLAIVDPLNYVDCLTMPKIIINSAGDQFFLPDSSRFYYDCLPGVKRLRYVPNTSHSLNTSVVYSLMALYMAMINNTPLPEYTWQKIDDNTIRVETPDSPSQVLLWTITNSAARDFRLETLGPAWQSTPLLPESDGSYIATVPTPSQGYSAFFIELSFPSPYIFPYTFTTGIQVIPDYLPYACDFNFDGQVDTDDVYTFAGQWLMENPDLVDIFPTATGDGAVDLLDLNILSRNYRPEP